MRKFTKILTFTLAILMTLSMLAACGDADKKSADTSGSTDTPPATEAPAGETQTWGDITLVVPVGMNMKGGDGTADPDDPTTLWLYDDNNPMNYMKVMIVEDEAFAQDSVDTTKEFNEEYSPVDVSFTAGSIDWKGVAYTYSGSPCTTIFATVGEKVFLIMSYPYAYDSAEMQTVCGSLK